MQEKNGNGSYASPADSLLRSKTRLNDLLMKEFKRYLTVMFTDFAGSTAIADEAGDSAARLVVKSYRDLIAPLVKMHNGVMVKTMGDGTLSYFDKTQDAVRAAVAIQQGIDELNDKKVHRTPLLARIGLHCGDVIIESDDIFGDVVNVASRFESMAAGGQIFLSEAAYHSLSDKSEFVCRFVKTAVFKGKKDTYNIYEALWSFKEENKIDFVDFVKEKDDKPTDMIVQRQQSTLDLLHARMEKKSDFPGLNRTFAVFSKLPSQGDYGVVSLADLTNTILGDFALTNKILKMVNTAFYSQYGGKVGTVSRALMLIGYIQVRNMALSLMLFEHIQDKTLAKELKSVIMGSFMSGIISRSLGERIGMVDTEEAFICSLFHDLGKLLAAYYLPTERKAINDLLTGGLVDEEDASAEVLGLSYGKLGMAIAAEWHLPDMIIESMATVKDKKLPRPRTAGDVLTQLTSFSSSLSGIILEDTTDSKAKRHHIDKLLDRFENSFALSPKQLNDVMNSLSTDLGHYSKVFGMSLQDSFLEKINDKINNLKSADEEKPKKRGAIATGPAEVQAAAGSATAQEASVSSTADTILQQGVYEVMNSLLDDYSVNDILRMVLEIMYRGMEFFRTLICIRNTRQNSMEGRFGFGSDIDAIIKLFKFPITDGGDIFNDALKEGSDMIVTNINAQDVKSRIPGWYRTVVNAQTFILLPIVINKLPIGLIYADKIYSSSITIPQQQLLALKTLRKQALLAFKQKL